MLFVLGKNAPNATLASGANSIKKDITQRA